MSKATEHLKNVDIQTVDPDSLVDIRTVKIDPDLPLEERQIEFIRQIKNPYCYKYGKAIIKISFEDTDVTLEDRLESYLMSL